MLIRSICAVAGTAGHSTMPEPGTQLSRTQTTVGDLEWNGRERSVHIMIQGLERVIDDSILGVYCKTSEKCQG